MTPNPPMQRKMLVEVGLHPLKCRGRLVRSEFTLIRIHIAVAYADSANIIAVMATYSSTAMGGARLKLYGSSAGGVIIATIDGKS